MCRGPKLKYLLCCTCNTAWNKSAHSTQDEDDFLLHLIKSEIKFQLEDYIVWIDTIQYSPEEVRYPCTSYLFPAFDNAQCHAASTE